MIDRVPRPGMFRLADRTGPTSRRGYGFGRIWKSEPRGPGCIPLRAVVWDRRHGGLKEEHQDEDWESATAPEGRRRVSASE
ncbi:MAG: hypothetical protein AABZ47_07925 [Planctomycetota bacterium]